MKSLQCTQVLAGHTDWVCALAVGAGGRLWSGSFKEMKIWDLDTLNCIDSVPMHRSHVRSIVVSESEESVVTASGDCNIQVRYMFGDDCRVCMIALVLRTSLFYLSPSYGLSAIIVDVPGRHAATCDPHRTRIDCVVGGNVQWKHMVGIE